MTSHDGSETVPIRIKGWNGRNKIYPIRRRQGEHHWQLPCFIGAIHSIPNRMNDKWDEAECELARLLQ